MANNTQVTEGGGDFIRDIDKAGVKTQVTILDIGGSGTETLLSSTNPLPVTGPLTDTQLRASAVPVSAASLPLPSGAATDAGLTSIFGRLADGTQVVTGPLTDTQLRAVAVPVSGPLTDTQIRATPLPVSGTFFQTTQPVSGTFWQTTQPVSIATPVTLSTATTLPVSGTFWQTTQPVSIATVVAVNDNAGSLTIDSTQLPTALAANGGLKIEGVASGVAVPVSGTFFQTTQPVSIATSVTVTGPLTDTQLRASAVPVSGTFFQTTQPVSIATSVNTVDAGDVAAGSADSGNPVKIGGKAIVGTAVGGLPTAVAANQRTNALMDVYGRVAVRATDAWAKNSNPGAAAQASCNSTAQATGVRNVCTGIALSLSSTAAATATNPVTFSLYDGTTAGTVLWVVRATMPLTAGSAWTYSQSGMWIEGTAATAMTLATAAATTTVVAATVSMTGTITQ